MNIVNFNYTRDDFYNKSVKEFFGENKKMEDFGISLEQYEKVEYGHGENIEKYYNKYKTKNDCYVELEYYAKALIYNEYICFPDDSIKRFLLLFIYKKASKFKKIKPINTQGNMLNYILDNFNEQLIRTIGW